MTVFLIWFVLGTDRWTSHVTTMADIQACEAARVGIAYCIKTRREGVGEK